MAECFAAGKRGEALPRSLPLTVGIDVLVALGDELVEAARHTNPQGDDCPAFATHREVEDDPLLEAEQAAVEPTEGEEPREVTSLARGFGLDGVQPNLAMSRSR